MDPKAGSMLDTTFVNESEWDCSCHAMDLIWHLAKGDAKAKG